MKYSSAVSSVLFCAALGLILTGSPLAWGGVHGSQQAGEVRGDAVQDPAATPTQSELKLLVLYQGKAIGKAQVSITTAAGAAAAAGVTSKAGTFSATLKPGDYAVAASSKGHVATRTVAIEGATKSLTLTLQ